MIDVDPQKEIERLRKKMERERRARLEAEAVAEQGTRLLYERGRQVELLYTVADAVSRAGTTSDAIQVGLEQICAYTGWAIGHAYLTVNEGIFPLAPSGLWHADQPEFFTEFRAVTETLHLRRGEGLPGRVLETSTSHWLADLSTDANFPRSAQARNVGLQGGVAVPVTAGGELVAVLEFFAREKIQPDKTLLDLAAQVGVQVGRTFEREAREEADRANQAKSEFLSRMSHELRTPLNAILGFGQLLELDAATPEQSESVRHILKGGRHLLDLINEVLDISRIESGQMQLSLEPVRVGDVLSDAFDLVQPLAGHRAVTVQSCPSESSQRFVHADRQRLKQVLLNLLANAIKYNREGGSVQIVCTETQARLRLGVKDTGMGIPAHKVQQLFTPFERLGAEHGNVEGTGLGLALSKRLMEMMGGTISVDTMPGEGSTFWVDLALTAPHLVASDAAGVEVPFIAEPACVQRTILYIEDNLANLALVERILSRRPDLKLVSAMQAGLGVDLARQHRPDLILLDLNLPDMNGYDALQLLLGDARTCHIPVIILSADATSSQLTKLLAAGAVAYLTKPLELPKFLQTLDDTLDPTGPITLAAS